MHPLELAALAVLGATSAYLGVSDWKRRTVDVRAIIICYCIAACINSANILTGSLAGPEVSKQPSTISMGAEGFGAAVSAILQRGAGSIFTLALLSCALLVFYRLDLLALGDVLSIPALLFMIVFAAQPIEIISYFVSAITFVLVLSVFRNIRNNKRHYNDTCGPLWHRLYQMCFCYYGDGDSCRYAFMHSDRIRRNYDNEPYYSGKDKTWLVPGLALISGFTPATAVLLVMMLFQ